jgi:hypothetical protein
MVKNKNKESVEKYENYDKEGMEGVDTYWYWNVGRLKKDKVKERVGSLKSTYGRMFAEYIKKRDIKWLQKKLNEMIDRFGKIPANMENIKLYMEWQKTPLDKNNHITVDWKLWPQTLNALEHLDHNIDFDTEFSDYIGVYTNLWSDDEKNLARKEFKEHAKEVMVKKIQSHLERRKNKSQKNNKSS